MRFDDVWPDDGPAQPADLPMVPNGVSVGQIVAVEDGTRPWFKTPANPNGRSLTLTVSVEGFEPVEAPIDATFRGKISAVCRAAGVPEPTRGADWDQTALVGRRVGVLTEQRTAKSGREYVTVQRWYSAAEAADHPPAVAPAQAARKPEPPPPPVAKPRKPKAEVADGDDIPF